MAWKWVENDSPEKPVSIDDTSSPSSIFVRKNFIKIPAVVNPEDPETNMPEHWKYEEEIVSRDEWPSYYSSMVNSANIDYIAMVTGLSQEEINSL